MSLPPLQKFLELARRNDWTPAFAEGHVDGDALRRRGKRPPKFLLVAFDEYSQGFRAGYFERAGQTPIAAEEPSTCVPGAKRARNLPTTTK